jgi:methyl-accepting chemotaxis protein
MWLLWIGGVGVGVLFITNAINLQRSVHDFTQAQEQRLESYKLGDELRQSSDDLTRAGRTAVVMQSSAFSDQFWDILSMRNGQKPRPCDSGRVYWDYLNAGEKPPVDMCDAESYRTRLVQAGFTKEEFSLLDDAQRESDSLALVEREALKKISAGFTASTQAAMDLHDDKYHLRKIAVMRNVDKFIAKTDKRTGRIVQTAKTDLNRQLDLLIWSGLSLVVGCLLCVVFSFRAAYNWSLLVEARERTRKMRKYEPTE